jgi:ribosomal protein S21
LAPARVGRSDDHDGRVVVVERETFKKTLRDYRRMLAKEGFFARDVEMR